jgi:hypothetical protein
MTLVCLLVASLPAGATTYDYRADIAPTGADAGTSPTLVITIKQLSSSSDKKVRSARVSAPDGFVIDTATVKKGNNPLPPSNVTTTNGSVTVNNISLNSGQTITVSVKAFIRCGTSGSVSWTVVGKNGTDYATGGTALSKDPDSDLDTDVTKCRLAFLTQPKVAQNGAVITSAAADPSGEAIKVELRNANGSAVSQSGVQVTLAISSGPSGVSLGGLTQVATNSNGVASFKSTDDPKGPRIGTSARDYRLVASASGIVDSDPSAAFDIEDVAKTCSGSCPANPDPKGGTTASLDVTSSGIVTASLGIDSGLTCDNAANDFYEDTTPIVTWNVTQANSRTVITIRLDASRVDRPYNLYDVCFSAPSYGFRNRFNVRIEPGEAGLLKICPPRLDKQNADPCVVDKWRENGDVLIKFSVPPGDPRGRI